MTVIAAEAAEKTLGQRAAAKAGEEARTRARQAPGQYRRNAGKLSAPGGNRYQTAILAEFIVAAGMVAFMPLATGGDPNRGGPSPYSVNDMVQLTAVAVVYFLLALVPGRGARWAAWLGLLVLLGLAYRKMATGELTAAITSIHPGSGSAGPTDQTL